jgi:hypothetical protein
VHFLWLKATLLYAVCQSRGTTLTIKHIFKECKQYNEFREEFKVSHLIADSLGKLKTNLKMKILKMADLAWMSKLKLHFQDKKKYNFS